MYSKDETTERTFAPYFVEPSGIGYACYVIGFDDLRGGLRTLKVERVYEARLTDERFTVPPSFDLQKLLASAWGVIWRDEGDIEVMLHFQLEVANLLLNERKSVILRAPTGSGKTWTALFPFLHAWQTDLPFPRKCLYVSVARHA